MPTSLRPAATGRPTQPRGTAAATSGPRAPQGTTLRPATAEGESLPIFQDPELMRRAEEALGLDGTRTYTDANGEWDLTIAPPGTPECRDYSKQQLQAMARLGRLARQPATRLLHVARVHPVAVRRPGRRRGEQTGPSSPVCPTGTYSSWWSIPPGVAPLRRRARRASSSRTRGHELPSRHGKRHPRT
ncbi:hypothetical protein [Nonomuraea dietziae]|uniref:hypothetical protein n=1 Tax=Nonomuraea dietziae TaxID=65515 RepID=UPI0031E32E2A